MDVLALVISALSLLVAAAGTYLATKQSKEALAVSQRAAVDARWFALQEAVQRLIGFDPTAEPVGERLANLRIAMVALVDHLPEWGELDRWLEAERALGATYGRQVMDAAKPGDNVEQRLQNLEPLMTWAQAFSSNLRFLKSKGRDAASLETLTSHAEGLVKQIHEKNGWDLPPRTNPRVQPLE